jgi:hypothetical protein
MISGSVALTTSNNTTSSLTYINNLITGSTTSGSYFTYVSNQYVNENIVNILRETYGYNVSLRNNYMGTNNDYMISWGSILDSTPTPIPTITSTITPTPIPTSTPTPTPTEVPLSDFLLMESGDSLLQENNNNILLEQYTPPV